MENMAIGPTGRCEYKYKFVRYLPSKCLIRESLVINSKGR